MYSGHELKSSCLYDVAFQPLGLVIFKELLQSKNPYVLIIVYIQIKVSNYIFTDDIKRLKYWPPLVLGNITNNVLDIAV